ncbi:hypothetical protein BUALT_Bualt12G0075100 [Buddleja alternifolia]|uniref:SRP54-type proteins GTP-binding domain-containing protein n=1 Tax=Buddleja alternifolia TaxID=168488 RepID=A0AAV6WP83_9LAMI|nr:hypothetical protein BUALT_Bualt12G0075100 [Buddleja alternifolia]
MVLVQLGVSISRALQQMSNATIIDEKMLNDCLNDIARALLQANVHFKLVRDMQTNIKKIVNFDDLAAGHNKHKIIQQGVIYGHILDFRIGENDDVYEICTLPPKRRAGNLLCYTKSDMRIAVEGVERFKKENCDLIIVDTSGRHKQEAALFEEMRQQYWSSCFRSNSSIQAAVGAVIVTKMDGHAKGGGALNAVAAMKNPVIFMGTGEHINEFEVLDVKPFVSRLLGMGDLSGFTDKIHEIVPMDQQAVLLQELSEGTFTLRNFLKMGPIVQAISILPGARQELMRKGHEKEVQANSKVYMMMMDLMTNEGKGCGRPVRVVIDMLEKYKTTSKTWKRLEISKKRDMNAQKMRHVRPPDMLRQFGGMGGLQNLMKQMCGGALRI